MQKNIRIPLMASTVLLITAFTIFNINWNIDPNYTIHFSGSKAEGSFSGLKGVIIFDPADLTGSKINIEVATSTIKTGNSTKDKHAKDDSWLDVARYPAIKFISTDFTKSGNDFIVNGKLELHGITKSVAIPFQFNNNIFTGSFTVKRKDFGIKGNMFGFVVGDEFKVELKVPVTKSNS